ncbi:MAG: DUF1566 domain-containing protein [Desulfobacterales bacterium]|nr:DUF1566 domain-containing protein [Desulfobacterales bacterium]
MDEKLLIELLIGSNKSLRRLSKAIRINFQFWMLIERINSIPEIQKLSYGEERNLYKYIAHKSHIHEMKVDLSIFFGNSFKSYFFYPRLLLFRKKGYFFLRSSFNSRYYASIILLKNNLSDKIALTLGFINPLMLDKNYVIFAELTSLLDKYKSVFEDKKFKGRVYGINLLTLTIITYTLKISNCFRIKSNNKTGYISFNKGSLISAELLGLKGAKAASEIFSWDDPEIETAKPIWKKNRNIIGRIDTIVIEGLRKKTRHTSVIDNLIFQKKEEKKKRLLNITASIFLVFVLSWIGTAVYFQKKETIQIQQEYTTMIEQIKDVSDLELKKNTIEIFLRNHDTKNKFLVNAQKELDKINTLIIEDEYKKVILSTDRELYENFLEKYPKSAYANIIRKNLFEIIDYEKLIKISQDKYSEKIKKCKKYLRDYPNGEFIDKVNNLLSITAKNYYNYIKKQSITCDEKEKWEYCLSLCAIFLRDLKSHPLCDKVTDLRAEIRQKKEFFILKKRAEQKGTDYEEAKKIYLQYLSSNHNSPFYDKIMEEIKTIELKSLEYEKKKIKSVSDKNGNLADKPNANIKSANKDINGIEVQKHKDIEYMTDALNKKMNFIKQRINHTNGRFRDNGDGTIIDTQTGLMWCMLDSYNTLGKCHDYNSAKKYVANLKTGGYKDWRIPRVSELSLIYKNKPYYPSSGATWYWSSEIFTQGWKTYSHIVNISNKGIYENDRADINEDCGFVHAVRP